MRATLESLLRARKLDGTLTTAAPRIPVEGLAGTGCPALDIMLGGGLRRGHLSEVVGAASTGRTTLMSRVLAASTARGEVTAIVDVSDTFDPLSAATRGVDLRRVLWVRDTGDPARALKAFSMILQAGGFGVVVLDLGDVPSAGLRRFPTSTWMRVARMVEGSQTVALLVGSDRIARSPGGVTIALAAGPVQWTGEAHRARLFAGVIPAPRVVSLR
jgi:recombination protein RecA